MSYLFKRLVISFDGTWNNPDDFTNVFHLHSMVEDDREKPEGMGEDRVLQLKYYDPGVGTGLLDKVTGGAFGVGLEENVREALRWLVEHYQEKDEIYVFGFSRGAFTARSLVGFLSMIGLPRKGAPFTLNQMWERYCAMGEEQATGAAAKALRKKREKQNKSNKRERAKKAQEEVEDPLLQISALRQDQWRKELKEGDWRKNYDARLKVASDEEAKHLSVTNQLIRAWCYRPPIHLMGIFDTVGAMGVESLAIPGLRSALAVRHNMRLHSTVGHACHAIAIHENRSSFAHTPLEEFVPKRGRSKNPDATIKQRWFSGAHSNVGGGYHNNLAATPPLQWMMEECRKLKLRLSEPPVLKQSQPDSKSILRSLVDSYNQFASPFWVQVFRAKRNYRRINPRPEHYARDRQAGSKSYTIRGIDAEIDPSVPELSEDFAPPNLVEYRVRELREQCQGNADATKPDAEISHLLKWAKHEWEGAGLIRGLWLLIWGISTGVGLWVLNLELNAHPELQAPHASGIVGGMTLFAIGVDFVESLLNFKKALNPYDGWRRALLDVAYWVRAVLVILFAIGFPVVVWNLFGTIWNFFLEPGWLVLTEAGWERGRVVFGVGLAAVALLGGLNALAPRKKRVSFENRRSLLSWKKEVLSVLKLVTVVGVVIWFVSQVGHKQLGMGRFSVWEFMSSEIVDHADARKAGCLAVLSWIVLAVAKCFFTWSGEPMARRRLSSILFLQMRCTPVGVVNQLRQWTYALSPERRDLVPSTDKAWKVPGRVESEHTNRLHQCLCECFWRDSLGLVVLYGVLFAYAMWYGDTFLWGRYLGPWCFWIPAILMVLDWFENAFQGLYLLTGFENRYQTFRKSVDYAWPNPLWVGISFGVSVMKNLGFLAGLALTFGVLIWGSWQVCGMGQWTWTVPVALCCVALALTAIYLGAAPLVAGLWRSVSRRR